MSIQKVHDALFCWEDTTEQAWNHEHEMPSWDDLAHGRWHCDLQTDLALGLVYFYFHLFFIQWEDKCTPGMT